jgi:hypothetical protein
LGNRLHGDGWVVEQDEDGAYYSPETPRASVAELSTQQRIEEAARVLAHALAEAGFPALGRLVTPADATDGPASVTMLPMRPDEARALAALISRSRP